MSCVEGDLRDRLLAVFHLAPSVAMVANLQKSASPPVGRRHPSLPWARNTHRYEHSTHNSVAEPDWRHPGLVVEVVPKPIRDEIVRFVVHLIRAVSNWIIPTSFLR